MLTCLIGLSPGASNCPNSELNWLAEDEGFILFNLGNSPNIRDFVGGAIEPMQMPFNADLSWGKVCHLRKFFLLKGH